MFIAKPHNLQLLGDPKVTINNIPIPRVYVTKILGVLIDDGVSWIRQANKVSQKC
jgi:hypothetical protein